LNAEPGLPGRRTRQPRRSHWLDWFGDGKGGSGSALLFLLLAPLLYAAYALLTPPFQTPDEQQHLFRAWQLSELQVIGERRPNGSGGVLPVSLGTAAASEIGSLEPHATREVVARPLKEIFAADTAAAAQARKFYDFRGAVIYAPAGYVPQVLSIWLGRSTGLSIETIIRIGRLLNGGLAILLIYLALRLAPVGALAILWVGLLPMSAAASASFGQDGMVIGGGCLLTAIGMRVLFNQRWSRVDLLVTAGLVSAVTLAKICYFPLALIGADPLAGRDRRPRRLIIAAAICIGALLLTALWLRSVADVTISPRPDIPPVSGRVNAWMRDPAQLLGILDRTFVANGPYITDTLFKFGWLSIGPVRGAKLLSLLGACLVVIAGDRAARHLRWSTRLWLFSIAGAVAVLVAAAIYLYSRPAGDAWAQGFQGRYLIPVAPALLLACLPARSAAPSYDGVIAFLMVSANILCLRTIVDAFYF